MQPSRAAPTIRNPIMAAKNDPRRLSVFAAQKSTSDYVKPSAALAKTHQFDMHPCYYDKEGKRQFYGMCVPTGRYCGKKCMACDPFCEGRHSAFRPYGAGITSYFKLLKFLIVLFLALSLCALPPLVINAAGTAGQYNNAIALSLTTMGNLASLSNTTLPEIVLPVINKTITKGNAALLYAFCDLAGAIFFLICYVWLKIMENSEANSVEKSIVTADDYTVYVEGLPEDVTEEEIRAHMVAVAKSLPGQADKSDVAAVNIVKRNMELVRIFTRRGVLYKKMERIAERVAFLQFMSKRHPDKEAKGCCKTTWDAELLKLKAHLNHILEKANQLTQKAKDVEAGGVIGAFVTMEYATARDAIVGTYTNSLIRFLCQPGWMRFTRKVPAVASTAPAATARNSVPHASATPAATSGGSASASGGGIDPKPKRWRLRISPAPAPNSILWENLHKGRCERFFRKLFTSLVAIIVVVVSFILLMIASYYQSQFSTASRALDCRNGAILEGLRDGTINSTSVASLGLQDPKLFCFCSSKMGFETMELAVLRLNPLTTRCPAQACPRLFTLDPAGVTTESFCVDWLKDKSITTAVTVAASLSIILVNFGLGMIMRKLTSFEAHHHMEALNKSLAERLFIAQFINTAVLILIVNAPIEKYVKIIPTGQTGKYDDFNPQWYQYVGSSLVTTMIINCFTPHIYSILRIIKWRWNMKNAENKAESQRDLNSIFVGPSADYSLRHAQLFNVVFVCYVFSTGMPLMPFVALCSILISYWMDKFFFIHLFRRPPAYGNGVTRIMTAYLPVALILHLSVGSWMLSNNEIFRQQWDPLRVSSYLKELAGSIGIHSSSAASAGAERLLQGETLPLFIMFLVTTGTFVLKKLSDVLGFVVFAFFNCLTCGFCAAEQGEENAAKAHEEAEVFTSYAQSLQLAHVNGSLPGAMQGIATYNMIENPFIQDAFAITPEFAKLNRSLSSVKSYVLKLKQTQSMRGVFLDNGMAGVDKSTRSPVKRNVTAQGKPGGLFGNSAAAGGAAAAGATAPSAPPAPAAAPVAPSAPPSQEGGSFRQMFMLPFFGNGGASYEDYGEQYAQAVPLDAVYNAHAQVADAYFCSALGLREMEREAMEGYIGFEHDLGGGRLQLDPEVQRAIQQNRQENTLNIASQQLGIAPHILRALQLSSMSEEGLQSGNSSARTDGIGSTSGTNPMRNRVMGPLPRTMAGGAAAGAGGMVVVGEPAPDHMHVDASGSPAAAVAAMNAAHMHGPAAAVLLSPAGLTPVLTPGGMVEMVAVPRRGSVVSPAGVGMQLSPELQAAVAAGAVGFVPHAPPGQMTVVLQDGSVAYMAQDQGAEV